MNRRWFVFGATGFAAFLGRAQQEHGKTPQNALPPDLLSRYESHRRTAVEINELGAHIQSLDDARRFIDLIAGEFADELPPRWITADLRERIAQAEFESATNPALLVSEQRLADAWNHFAGAIGAPDEAIVNGPEIHTLRDSFYTTAQLSWSRGNQNIWTAPMIYAVGPDGKVAQGCRVMEAFRVIWDLSNQFENLRWTRELVKKGQYASDLFAGALQNPRPQQARFEAHAVVRVLENPVRAAEMEYARRHGPARLGLTIKDMVCDILPS